MGYELDVEDEMFYGRYVKFDSDVLFIFFCKMEFECYSWKVIEMEGFVEFELVINVFFRSVMNLDSYNEK